MYSEGDYRAAQQQPDQEEGVRERLAGAEELPLGLNQALDIRGALVDEHAALVAPVGPTLIE